MKLPLLLLNRVGLTETPIETARRRARALAQQVREARFREMLREEQAQMQSLRQAMAEHPKPKPKRRWAIAAE